MGIDRHQNKKKGGGGEGARLRTSNKPNIAYHPSEVAFAPDNKTWMDGRLAKKTVEGEMPGMLDIRSGAAGLEFASEIKNQWRERRNERRVISMIHDSHRGRLAEC